MAVEIRDYIASQISAENIDELQRMALSSVLGLHIALDGPPGVGKTQSVMAFSKITGRKVFDKGCSEDTTENQIIGFPRLVEQNGATVTAYENGPLAKAMSEGGIFYGDEFNLLRRDKQKRLNSAFDDRRRISRADGVEIEAKNTFTGIISYNPSQALSVQDLEESVADRFVHFNYRYMAPKIEAYLGSFKIPESSGFPRIPAESFGIKLEKRAILIDETPNGSALTFLLFMPDRKCWINFFTGAPVPSLENGGKRSAGIYYAQKTSDRHTTNSQPMPDDARLVQIIQDYSLRVSGYFSTIRQLVRHGSSALPQNVRTAVTGMGEMGQVALHLPSLRIQSCAVAHLVLLIRMGMDPRQASAYASSLIVNQICFGRYRDRKNGELTGYEIASSIAESFSLLPPGEIQKINARFNKKDVAGD